MGSAGGGSNQEFDRLVDELGSAIARNGCVLVTGETSGLPGMTIEAVRRYGGLSVGISPAHDGYEQQTRFMLPPQSSDVVIYTGFGVKGRNVVNIRASDIVIIFSGKVGTLNEITIAYDEGKVIGILEGTGGVADLVAGLVDSLGKKTKAVLVYDRSPRALLDRCLAELKKRSPELFGAG